MKYKHIDSALHNFGHSFVSLMNYVDGEYVDDILERVAREMPGNKIRIDFSVGTIEPSFPSNSKLNTSIEYWREWLPKLLSSQAVEIESLGPVVLRYRLTCVGREVIMEVKDDRGCQHKVFVQSSL